MSGISEDLFAMKLYEMEQQYGKLQGRLRVCCRERREELQEELKKAKAEYEVNALLLRKSVEGSRSPAVKKLAQAQWSYLDTMARLLEDQSVSQLCLEEGTPEEDRAEAAALYAEYAMDFATQSAQYAKKNAILTDKEKLIVSYHETGHALVAALQTHSAPVQKITIVPRTSGALGYTMQVDEGNHYLMSQEELENKIATLTGGRAAEELIFNSASTGASNDIEQATKLARAMITRYGMSDDFDMVALETVNNQYLGGDASLTCSAETQTKIDQQVVELVKGQHQKALRLLQDNRQKLDEIAKYLYEKETITGDEFMRLLNGE